MLDRAWRSRLPQGSVCDPPPFDLSPGFPCLAFGDEDVPYLGEPGEAINAVDAVVAHIVPTPDNRYASAYGFGFWGPQESPAEVQQVLETWIGDGKEVVVHQAQDGVKVVGCGSGFSRFLVGWGISIFIIREVRPVPNGMKVKGTTLNGSVAVLRCRVTCSAGSVPVYHLLPKEYLADPPLPGLPANVSAEDFERLVPPPPPFRVGTTFWPGSKYHHAIVIVGLSMQERREGGKITPCGTVKRGRTYAVLNGFVSVSTVVDIDSDDIIL